jgi:hypothetical protein
MSGVELTLPRQHHGGESLVDLEEVDLIDLEPGLLEHPLGGGMGPVSMMVGSTPASEVATMRARGVSLSALARASDMIRRAAAPSEICDEFPR